MVISLEGFIQFYATGHREAYALYVSTLIFYQRIWKKIITCASGFFSTIEIVLITQNYLKKMKKKQRYQKKKRKTDCTRLAR